MVTELDHAIVFVPGPVCEDDVTGWVLDPGRRHEGQGTRNRRVLFASTFLELLWIDDPAVAGRSGLGFADRCAPDAPCPFGVVLRGPVPLADRDAFRSYRVPGGGPELQLLGATLTDPHVPFVAVWEHARPVARDARVLQHPNGARGIRRATVVSPAAPGLGSLMARDVAFWAGRAQLRLDLRGLSAPWVLDPASPVRACRRAERPRGR